MSAHGITPRSRVGIDATPHAEDAPAPRSLAEIEESLRQTFAAQEQMIEFLQELVQIKDQIIALYAAGRR